MIDQLKRHECYLNLPTNTIMETPHFDEMQWRMPNGDINMQYILYTRSYRVTTVDFHWKLLPTGNYYQQGNFFEPSMRMACIKKRITDFFYINQVNAKLTLLTYLLNY